MMINPSNKKVEVGQAHQMMTPAIKKSLLIPTQPLRHQTLTFQKQAILHRTPVHNIQKNQLVVQISHPQLFVQNSHNPA